MDIHSRHNVIRTPAHVAFPWPATHSPERRHPWHFGLDVARFVADKAQTVSCSGHEQ